MKISDIIKEIENIAIPHAAANWDLSGLQVFTPREDASCIGVFLDPTPDSILTAIKQGAQFLLSHHPLSLNPKLPNKNDSYNEALRLLFSSNVSLYAAHTSLDVNMDGPAGWLGRALNLKNTIILEDVLDDSGRIGYGESGDLPEPLPLGVFLNIILKQTNMDCAQLCGPTPDKVIARIAYCCGSASSLATIAARNKVDIFITGDVKYHAALDAPIPILDIGHHSLEEKMMQIMAEILIKRLPEVRIIFIPSQSPFRNVCL